MSLNELLKRFPVSDFMTMTRMRMLFGLNIPRGRLLLEPEVDGIATDLKDCAGFAAFHPILFNRCYDFAAQVVTVRFCHRCYSRGMPQLTS